MKILAILLLLASCISKPPAPTGASFTLEAADLTIRLLPLGREELKRRHGSNTDSNRNPFIDYPAQFLKKRIVVFETEISTDESEVLFRLNEIHLEVGGAGDEAASSELLMNYWSGYTSQVEAVLMQSLMRKTMLRREFSVNPDNPVRGYLVFAHSFPKKGGEAVISFNVITPDGNQGLLEWVMEFTETGVKEEKKKPDRTGISVENS